MKDNKEKNCISCGVVMKDKSDYYQDDDSMDYCIHCANLNGSMKSFDEMVLSMMTFLKASHGLEGEEARRIAIEMLKRQPAWQNQ